MRDKLIEIKRRLMSHDFQLGVMFATAIWLLIIAGYHLMN